MTRRLIHVAIGLAAVMPAATPTPAAAERLATRVEKAFVLDAFNRPGRSFASRCVRVEVSTADARWAILSTPARPPRACVQAGEVGDGYVVLSRRLVRPTAAWRIRRETSGEVACVLPVAVRVDFFGQEECGPFD